MGWRCCGGKLMGWVVYGAGESIWISWAGGGWWMGGVSLSLSVNQVAL